MTTFAPLCLSGLANTQSLKPLEFTKYLSLWFFRLYCGLPA